MDTKGPINPPSKQNSYIHVIVDAFSHFVVTVPVKQNNAQNAVNSLLHHWITNFGPPIYLVTDHGSECIISELANLLYHNGNQAFIKNSLRIMDKWFSREPKQKPWNPSQTFFT